MIKTSKQEYNKAKKIILKYESEQRVGSYQIIYQLHKDIGTDYYRERLIKSSSAHKAIDKFLKNAPNSLYRIDEGVKFNNEEIYVGDHPDIKEYL